MRRCGGDAVVQWCSRAVVRCSLLGCRTARVLDLRREGGRVKCPERRRRWLAGWLAGGWLQKRPISAALNVFGARSGEGEAGGGCVLWRGCARACAVCMRRCVRERAADVRLID